MRIESSIITSLSELRAIEQQRISDERAAIERERVAELEARRAAEQAKLEAEQARLRAEREERTRIEIARAGAERDARMRVEAAEAAVRARLAAQLEERRMAEELELKRAEVAKQRPTWMLAVTALATVAAVGLTWFAIDRSREVAAAETARETAVHEKEAAKQGLREARDRLAVVQKDVEQLDAEITRLTKQLTDAQDDADRKKVARAIAEANERKREAQRRLDEAKAKEWKRERNEKVDVTGCTDTALGCLK